MYPLPKHMKQSTTTNEIASTNLHIRMQYSTNATNIVTSTKNDLITRECKKNRELTNIGTIYQCSLLMQIEMLKLCLFTTLRYFFFQQLFVKFFETKAFVPLEGHICPTINIFTFATLLEVYQNTPRMIYLSTQKNYDIIVWESTQTSNTWCNLQETKPNVKLHIWVAQGMKVHC